MNDETTEAIIPTESPFDGHVLPTEEMSLDQRRGLVMRAQQQALELVEEGIIANPDQFPVNVYDVIRRLGLSVKEGPLHKSNIRVNDRDIAGAIIKDVGDDAPVILLEETGTPEHKLFTASHELGHYLFWVSDTSEDERKAVRWGDVRPEHPAGKDDGDVLSSEYLANTFAQYLLMPDKALAAALQEGLDVNQLAERFGVTSESAIRRLSYLDLSSQTF